VLRLIENQVVAESVVPGEECRVDFISSNEIHGGIDAYSDPKLFLER